MLDPWPGPNGRSKGRKACFDRPSESPMCPLVIPCHVRPSGIQPVGRAERLELCVGRSGRSPETELAYRPLLPSLPLSPQLLSLSLSLSRVSLSLFYLFINFVIPFSLVPMLAGTIHHATEPRPPLPCVLPLTPKSGIRQTHPTAVQAFPLFINQNGVINHVPTA